MQDITELESMAGKENLSGISLQRSSLPPKNVEQNKCDGVEVLGDAQLHGLKATILAVSLQTVFKCYKI